MPEKGKKLDPTKQADWEKIGKNFDADFGDILKAAEKKGNASKEAVVKASKKDKEKFTPEEQLKIDKLKNGLDEIFNNEKFNGYKNFKKIRTYKKQIIAKVKIDVKNGAEFDPLDILLDKAKSDDIKLGKTKKRGGASAMFRILLEIKNSQEKIEKTNSAQEKEKKDPSMDNAEKAQENLSESILEKAYNKLKSAGADDEDAKYFFNLIKKERERILSLDGDELANEISKLKEMREADGNREKSSEKTDTKKEIYDNPENEKMLRYLGEEVAKKRSVYLQKKYEINKITSRISRFFGAENKMKFENAEKEADLLKEDYRKSVSEYSGAIVDLEGVNDSEEQEIMLHYLNIRESLNFQEEELRIKVENDPELLQRTQGILEKAFVGYLHGYKGMTTFLSRKASEFVATKTDSKILKLAGGLGGGVAFGVGLSNVFKLAGAPYWVTKALMLAASTTAMTLENKENLDKESKIEESNKNEQRRLESLEKISQEVESKFNETMKEVFSNVANESLDYQEQKKAINNKLWREAIGKSVGKTALYFTAGLGTAELLKSFCEVLVDFKNDIMGQEVKNVPAANMEDIKTVDSHHHRSGGALHSATNFPKPEELPVGAKAIPVNNEANLTSESNPNQANIEAKPVPAPVSTSIPDAEPIKSSPESSLSNLESSVKSVENIKINSGGIKDNLKEYLVAHSNELTEGKMGWNPDKYKSVEDWANRRAIGIVGELQEKYPNYNFNKISASSAIDVDLSNKADIKIVGFDDPNNLGGKADNIADLKKYDSGVGIREQEVVSSKESVKNIPIEKSQPIQEKFDVEKEIGKIKEELELNRMATEREINFAQKLGFTPEEYSELNNISLNELAQLRDSANSNSSNVQLKRIFNYLENGKGMVLDKNQTISDVVRSLDASMMDEIFSKDSHIFTENFDLKQGGIEYAEYVGRLVTNELSLAMGDKTNFGSVFRAIGKIGAENINNQPEGGLFQMFKEVSTKITGKIEFGSGDNVRKYVLKAIKKAIEQGKMDEFKLAIKEINLNKQN